MVHCWMHIFSEVINNDIVHVKRFILWPVKACESRAERTLCDGCEGGGVVIEVVKLYTKKSWTESLFTYCSLDLNELLK